MNRLIRRLVFSCCAILLPLTALAKSALPPHNPFLADSTYPVAHGYGDFTTVAGPVGPGRQLRADEIVWKGVGPINGYAPT